MLSRERNLGDPVTLWKLTRIGKQDWDVADGFVVRAPDENHARLLASKRSGDEGEQTWLRPEKSTCEQVTEDGPDEIILRDFNAA